MATTFETEMMRQCCGEKGKLDFERMEAFMKSCGKEQFSDDEIEMIKQLCSQERQPDCGRIKQFMTDCGCRCEYGDVSQAGSVAHTPRNPLR